MGSIKIAVIDVGSCASALIQGLSYYRDKTPEEAIGLMHWEIGGYQAGDIEIAAAFDIDERKVGHDVARAIFARPNCTSIFCEDIQPTGVKVAMSPILDGLSAHMRDYPDEYTFVPAREPEPSRDDVVQVLPCTVFRLTGITGTSTSGRTRSAKSRRSPAYPCGRPKWVFRRSARTRFKCLASNASPSSCETGSSASTGTACSIYPLPWGATTRHKESEGSAYYRHFYMGLIRADGTPKGAIEHFDPAMGICQWFHFDDHRLTFAVDWLRRLGVKKLRTGFSWADWHRPNAMRWFDRQMAAINDFDTTVTLCFTPPSRGKRECYTSPPLVPEEFAYFAREVIERYVPPTAMTLPGQAATWTPSLLKTP